ncbi:Thyroid adenoma-associated protein like [Schistosoma japonicum]|nr:Thyroid adenoma-associated protein like [Schistosoma japonicum]KAH8875423.1 Thyroid adenoma-associated protein like [Schistosoma japonicum]
MVSPILSCVKLHIYISECQHPRLTGNCVLKLSCEYLNDILIQIVSDSCYSRGTVAMLTQFVRCIFKKSVYKTIALLYSLDFVCQPSASEANLEICGRVVSKLMKIANDPSLASSISELYTLIAQRFWIENDPSINAWLSSLIDALTQQSTQTFHSTINQNLLPSLMKINPKLLELLVKCCNNDSVQKSIHLSMFLLTCYHLLSINGRKTDCCSYLSLDFLKSCLGSYDNQLRLTALNVLVSLIVKSKERIGFSNEKLEMLVDYLRYDLWPTSKHIHSQIVNAIKDILLHLLTITKRKTNVEDPLESNLESFYVQLIHILLTHIYPGSPASRMSLGLAGFYTVIECFYSMFSVDEFRNRIMNYLCKATKNIFSLINVSSIGQYSSCGKFELTNQDSELHLYSILLIGLSSRYDVDRDYAVKILLKLNILKQLNPSYINKLWSNTLEIYAQSSKPDVSPIAGDLLRFLIFGDENDDSLTPSSSSPFSVSLSLSSSAGGKAVQAIDFLLNQLEEQIIICEKFPIYGLMSVVTNKPFYGLLSAIRSIICVSPSSPLNEKVEKYVDFPTLNNTSIKPESLFKQNNGISIVERIISLGLRISEIVLPVVGHESPEGVLLTSEEDLVVDTKATDEEINQLYKLCEKTRKYPEYLILCCWRSVRELSLLMGISLVSYGFHKSAIEQMKPNEVFRIAEFFCTQLLCCRHRGAFELCATGFTIFCTALVNHPTYCTIPIHWLNALTGHASLFSEKLTNSKQLIVQNLDFSLESCMGKHDTTECITRRGAGCPLFVQAILSANLTRDGTNDGITILKNTVCWLLKSIKTSLRQNNLQQFSCLGSCVLHLNIIRGVFQSTNLNYHTDCYLQKALIIALNGLECQHLPIRNASMLFYSTIIQRIFGVNRSKAIKSRKNCLSTSTFFKRYPKLEHYLVDTFTWYSKNTNIPHASCFKLYSMLYLITHLLPPTEVSEIDKTLYKLLISCSFNYDIRIRKMASLALTSIIHPNFIMITLNHLLDLMKLVQKSPLVNGLCNNQSNILHCLLLQVYALLYSRMDIHGSVNLPTDTVSTVLYLSKSNYAIIINRLKVSFSWLLNNVTCPIIKQLYIKILHCEYDDDQIIQIETSQISLEYDYLEVYINVLIDRAFRNTEIHSSTTETTYQLEIVEWIKSMNAVNFIPQLLTIALRRICSYLHSTLERHCNDFDMEDINDIIDSPNSSIISRSRKLFSFQTLFHEIIYSYYRLDENSSHNNDNNEVCRYTFALLAVVLRVPYSLDIPMDLIHTSIQWSHKQLKLLCNKVKSFNSPPIYLASFIRFYVNLIKAVYCSDKSSNRREIPVFYLYDIYEFSNIYFNVFHDSTTHACLEVKYAVLQSLCLLDISTIELLKNVNTDNNLKEDLLQSFDILIDNMISSDSSKLRKLACEIVQNLLVTTDSRFKCVLQLPHALLPNLINLLLIHGSEVVYEHLLQFVRNRMCHLKRYESYKDNTCDHAFPQTTLKSEDDQLELIRIICNSISNWLYTLSNSSSIINHRQEAAVSYESSTDILMYREIDLNELDSLLILKPDFMYSLYLNKYIHWRLNTIVNST